MGTTNYYKGRAREYRVLQALRRDGWFCTRSAASHSPVDIFAGKDGRTLMIQVKSGRGKLAEAERKTLIAWARAFNGRAEVWHFKRGRTPEIETLF
jgi:Holliday junction resolvase